MKILTNKKQQRLMALIYKAQKSAICGDFCKLTDLLAEIAGEVLTLGQLCALKDKICEKEAFEVSVTPIKQHHDEEELERLQKKIDRLKEELDFVTGKTNE